MSYSVPEETAVVDVIMEGERWEAMIDSGASLLVICIDSLRELDLQHKMEAKPETLRAFDNTTIQSMGTVPFKLNMRKIEVVQRFTTAESKDARMTTVLGRDFQMRFQSVEFLWQEGKIRIGTEWFTSKMWVCGSEMNERVTSVSCCDQRLIGI